MRFRVGDKVIEDNLPEQTWTILKVDEKEKMYYAEFSLTGAKEWYDQYRMELDSRALTPLEQLL